MSPIPFHPPLCALVVGHSKSDGGAVSASGAVREFDFNDALASDVADAVNAAKCGVKVMHRTNYTSLPAQINAVKPDFVLEMHCNAYNGRATGSEVLFWKTSSRGAVFAGILQRRILEGLGLTDRGTKGITGNDRGGFLLRRVLAPALICEPFFIDNPQDLRVAFERREFLVTAYARAIEDIAGVIVRRPIK